jgi:hypothetical protein
MKKILFSAIFLFWLANSAATLHTAPPKHMPASGDAPQDACFLEYVTGLSTLSTTPVSITLGWNPVKGAAYYRIKTFDSVNHAFISSTVVVAKSANNVATVIDLIPGVSYQFVVTGLCANGHESL